MRTAKIGPDLRLLQQVPLLPLIKLNQHSGAVFDYIFLFLLASPFLNFFSEGKKNLVNSENNENLSNHQLLNKRP